MRSDFGMLVARLIVGGAMAAHGAQKAFGWFGGAGPEKASGFMRMLGFVDGEKMSAAAAYNELLSGALIGAGFLGPVAPFALLVNMIVAIETVHKEHGFFASENGVEVPLLYASAALAFASGGYGACSLDKLLGLEGFFGKRRWFYLGLAATLGAATSVLNQRSPSAPQGGQQTAKAVEDEKATTAA